MKKVLIAYDGSPGADMAIRELVRGGLPDAVEARVLMVADVWLPADKVEPDAVPAQHPGITISRERVDEALRESRRIVAQGAELLRQIRPSWKISDATIADSPGWGILSTAREWGADLVVIGSHGHPPLERLFVGSVSYKVAAEASCSVRVVRHRKGPAHGPERLLIGMDGSEDSEWAVDEVSKRQWHPATQVEFVTVTDARLISRMLERAGLPHPTSEPGRIEDSMRKLLEASRAKLTSRGLTVHSHFFEGDPKRTLLRQAAEWDVDCIFLGARGIDHGRRLYLGTVASAICSRAHCTVEIVRRPREAGTTPTVS